MFWVITAARCPRALELRERAMRVIRLARRATAEAPRIELPDPAGSRRNASMVATSIGSNSAQMPVAERKSGIPLSVETPAPVSATTAAARGPARQALAASAQAERSVGRWTASPSRHEVRVRFAETDAQGIAHHASFVVWLEVARVAYLGRSRAATAASASRASKRSPRGCTSTIAGPRISTSLTVWTRCVDLRGARFRYEYRIVGDGELVAEAYTRHATVDRASYRPMRVPAGWPRRSGHAERRRLRRRRRQHGRRGGTASSAAARTGAESPSAAPASVLRLLLLGLRLRLRLRADADDRGLADVVRAPGRVVQERAVRGRRALHARLARRCADLLDTRSPFSIVGSAIRFSRRRAGHGRGRRLALDPPALRRPVEVDRQRARADERAQEQPVPVSFVNLRSRSG